MSIEIPKESIPIYSLLVSIRWGWSRDKKNQSTHKNKSSIRIQGSGGSSEETKEEGKKRKKGKLSLKGAFMSRPNKSWIKQHAAIKFMPNVGEYLSNCTAQLSRRHLPLWEPKHSCYSLFVVSLAYSDSYEICAQVKLT